MTSARKVHSGHIILALANRFDWFQNTMMTEFDIDGGRADVVFITRARQLTEIEIKISRSDWNADALKGKWKRVRPHVSRFYYAIPEDLADRIPAWVPDTAGIIAVFLDASSLPRWREVRPAKRRRADRVSDHLVSRLHEAAYYRFWRREIQLLRGRYWRRAPELYGEAAE